MAMMGPSVEVERCRQERSSGDAQPPAGTGSFAR
jgi:hypothetical protein